MKRSMKVLFLALVVAASSVSSYAGCTQQYIQDVESCSNISDWVGRSACGLDAGLEYAGCVRRTVIGL